MMEITNTLHSGMCRCCASEGTFKDIKTKYHWMGEEEVYADMLTDCFDIKICTPEDLDNGICEVCITQLRNAANFKKQVLHTEEQFKRRLQLKDVKNPIKLESVDEDPIESDHVSDPDFSGTEYEVPIKQEVDEKPKPRKRPAKATTSRAKKPKVEPESSKKRAMKKNLNVDRTPKNEDGISNKPRVKKLKAKSKANAKHKDDKGLAEIYMHRNNIRVILECTNATPIRGHSDIGYQCSFCVNEYPNPADLKNHTIQNHDHDLKTKRDFTWDKIMDTFRVKLDITALRCDFCGIDFESLEPLMEHLIDSHEKKLYTDIKSHILPFKFTDEALRCVFCTNVSSTFKALQEHMMIHFRNYICEQCDSGFINRKMLRNHSKTHDVGTFKCNSCPKVFDTLPKQKAHERRVHSGTKLNRCGYCNEKFRDFVQKVKHQKEVHGVQTETQKCQACDKTFKTQAALKTHVKRDHLIERPYQCTECDMAFFLKAGLKHHLVKHTGTKEFTCEICCKSYGLKKILTEHMKIHADNRCFKCEHCDMAFVQKSGLRGHMRSKHSDLI